MFAPDYETSGPTRADVKEAILEYYADKKFPPESTIDKCIDEHSLKYGGFGSWRGFYCGGLDMILDTIEDLSS